MEGSKRLYLFASAVTLAIAATVAALIVGMRKGQDATAPPGPQNAYLVYFKGQDLWITTLDRSLAPMQLTFESCGAGFAGSVRRNDGGLDLYYTSEQCGEEPEFVVYRTSVPFAGSQAEVARFDGVSKNAEFSCCNAAVSPDGRSLAYTDRRGLWVKDLDSGKAFLLSANGAVGEECRSPRQSECFGNFLPSWAPDSKTLVYLRVYYEGSELFLVKPSASEGEKSLGRDGFTFRRFSQDGKELCTDLGIGGISNSPVILNLETGKAFWLSEVLLAPVKDGPLTNAATGCAWSSDGRVAFSYVGENLNQHTAVLDRHRKLVGLADGGPVVAWLPDGSGIIFRSMPNPLEPTDRYRIWRSGDYPVRLDLDADLLLAVIPVVR